MLRGPYDLILLSKRREDEGKNEYEQTRPA